MVKLIIFDLSNVCFNNEEDLFLKQFAKENNLDLKELEEAYIPLVKEAEVGKSSGKKVWKEVLQHFGLTKNVDEIISSMIKQKVAYKDMLELVKKLGKKYTTVYFTNYNETYWNVLSKKFNLKDYFHDGIVSFQIKSRKPELQGFEFILEKYNVKPEDAVFTDDSEKNLVHAAALGIKTIHFQNQNQFLKELKEIGVEIPQ